MRAGNVSCLLVLETMFKADSHFLPKFQRCQESSPLLEESPDQFWAPPRATPALFQAVCGLRESRGNPDSTGNNSSEGLLEPGHCSAPQFS